MSSTDWKSIAIRGFIGLLFAFWSLQVVTVAVFAVGDRYSGVEAAFMSIIVLAGGFAPVGFLIHLCRDRLSFRESSAERGREPQDATRTSIVPTQALAEALSERELEVLALIARGLSNKEIATNLSVTVGTVKPHTNNINRKLGSRSRTEALARAREHGIL